MNANVNLGKISASDFKESQSAAIARFFVEKNNRIKTHFLEMDKTPNFDGKAMILDGSFERITVEVQIKTLPKHAKKKDGTISFQCDTKAMNCVLYEVTLNPVALLVVDCDDCRVYYKLLTKEYVMSLDIGAQETKNISLSESDIFQDNKFINEVCNQIKLVNTDCECITECKLIRDIINNAQNTLEENFQLVYQRDVVKGYFTAYRIDYKDIQKTIIIGKIKMQFGELTEPLFFHFDKDFIRINRSPSEKYDIKDTDIANIILEIAKELKKPILYTNAGKPTFWFELPSLWQLRSKQIDLDWYLLN